MEIIAILLFSLIIIIIMFVIINKLLKIIDNISKLIKSENLQDFELTNWNIESTIDVWQNNDRFIPINEISDKDLKNIDINPENIYNWKIEHFTN